MSPDACARSPSPSPGPARLFRDRGVCRVWRPARGREAPDTGDLHILRRRDRRRWRDSARPPDRSARFLGQHQFHAADLHRRRAGGVVHEQAPLRRPGLAVVRCSGACRLCDLWRGQGPRIRSHAGARIRDGRAERVRGRDHPRRAGRRAVDPDAAGAVRYGRRAFGGAACRPDDRGDSDLHRGTDRSGRGLRLAWAGHRPRLVHTGVPRQGLPHCSMVGMLAS